MQSQPDCSFAEIVVTASDTIDQLNVILWSFILFIDNGNLYSKHHGLNYMATLPRELTDIFMFVGCSIMARTNLLFQNYSKCKYLARSTRYCMDKSKTCSQATTLLEKYPSFFANTLWISMKRACLRRPWTFIRMSEFFPACQQRQLITSSIWVK